MGNRVAVLSPEGQFGTVDAADAEAVTRAGGKVLSKQELAAREQQEKYDNQSTLTKVATVASMAGPAGYGLHAYLRGQGAVLPPELEAYQQGVSGGFTGGLASVGMKEAVRLAGGDAAAKAYAETAEATKQAHGGAYAAGEIAGFVGGAVAGGPKAGLSSAGKIIPSVGIGAVGNAVEQAAARGLAGVAERGVIGRALATGGSLAARGAAEGALYAGAQTISEDMLGDKETAADKLFATMGLGALAGGVGGGVLGFGGSLGASGARAAGGAAIGGLSRVLNRGAAAAETAQREVATLSGRAELAAQEARKLGSEVASEVTADAKTLAERTALQGKNLLAEGKNALIKGTAEAAEGAEKAAKFVADKTGTSVEQEMNAARAGLDRLKSAEVQKGWAHEQAWKAVGAGQGLQSTEFVKRAERYLPNGVKDVGETLLRKGIINTEEGWVAAAKNGTPAAMLPRIETSLEEVGQRLGAITDASGGRVAGLDIGQAVSEVASQYEKSAATRPIGRAIRAFGQELRDSLGLQALDGSVAVQDLVRERKALDKIVFENAPLDPSITTQVKRDLRAKLEGLVVQSLDESSGKLSGELAKEYKALKKDYLALSIASDAAEDSAARMAKARSLSLTDYLAGGGSLATSVAHKLVRERGNAAAAVLLSRMADMGTITRTIQGVEDMVGKAATGLLEAPKRLPKGDSPTAPLPELPPRASIRQRAEEAMKRVAEYQADPETFVNTVTRRTEGISVVAPNVTSAVVQRAVSAVAFLASKVPPVDRDPLDPHPAPHLTDAQAHEIAQYSWYLDKPARFFEEASRGKLTFEGAEVARVLMPGAFAQLQTQVLSGMADSLAKGVRMPFAQREKVGLLLGVPATPSQRPEHMALLQQNVSVAPAAGQGPTSPQAQGPKRPAQIRTQQSALDRLEGEGPGRR